MDVFKGPVSPEPDAQKWSETQFSFLLIQSGVFDHNNNNKSISINA